ncbi:MAG: sigma-54-dependent Fis family transcriptional regulator [Desulfobacterales bacterium]|nr:sigma-54-dependent Fis family transcriptional regulator [Desulfobacterales bacterium]
MPKILYPRFPIFAIDDDNAILESLEFMFKLEGLNNIISCNSPDKVMEIISTNTLSVILLDILMPNISGEQLLMQITQNYPEIPIIILTGLNDLETAVKFMRYKAYDYIVKPINEENSGRLINAINRAIEYREMQTEITRLKQGILGRELKNPENFSRIITTSKLMYGVFQYIEAISESRQPVLITGETGVGKELIADAIHKCSDLKGDFVAVNISGLDENIFADTLFGHIRGSFTGADKSRKGLVQKASGGSLFLDEIGDLSMESQVKLLRLIQEREYFALGSDSIMKANVRIIAATNKDLKKLKESGGFRNDLYYRLNSHHVYIPPLRDRLEDLPILIDNFLEIASQELNKKKPSIPTELITLLSCYNFPGNIRELKAMIYNALINHTSRILSMKSFREYLKENLNCDSKDLIQTVYYKETTLLSSLATLPTIKQMVNELITETLNRTKGNQSIASQQLGISRQTLMKHCRRMNLQID